MKIKKLPPTLENTCLISKGEFLTNITYFSVNSGSLEIDHCELIRTSRFNNEDFQNYIEKNFQGNNILFSDNIDRKKFHFLEYINRSRKFEKSGFSILAEILGVDSIVFFNVSFSSISAQIYSGNKIFSTDKQGKQLENDVRNLKWNINNYLFDPYIPESPDTFIDSVEGSFGKLLKSFGPNISKLDVNKTIFIFSGEYIWSNNPAHLVHSLIKSDNFNTLKILLDSTGVFEALLSEGGMGSRLKYLSKREFGPNVICQIHKQEQNKLTVYKKDGPIEKFLYDNTLNIFSLKNDERVKGLEFPNGKGILVVMNGKDNKNNKERNKVKMDYSKFIFPLITRKISEREDYLVELKIEKRNIDYYETGRKAIKVFDYIHSKNLNKIKLAVIDGELVEKGTLLCKFGEYGSLVEKRILAHEKGYVDLSNINSGYIFLQEKNPKLERLKFTSYTKLRPRKIIGRTVAGKLGKDIKYINKLTKKDYTKFVQSGFRAVICNSIEHQLFFDIEEFHLENLLTVVILDGLDVDTAGKFILEEMNGHMTEINNVNNSVIIGHEKKISNAKSFYMSNEVLEPFKYKIGHNVRIIDDNNWGDYARIVAVEKGKIKLKSGKSKTEISLINLN